MGKVTAMQAWSDPEAKYYDVIFEPMSAVLGPGNRAAYAKLSTRCSTLEAAMMNKDSAVLTGGYFAAMIVDSAGTIHWAKK